MLLTEPIEDINRQLVDLFGIDTISGQAMYRVVWSEDQYEKRLMDTTDNGIVLIHPEVRLVPKYKQWVRKKYVLENLVIIPEINIPELPTTKTSYEPLWVFQNDKEEYLPPALWACQFVIDTVRAAMGKAGMKKYIDEEALNPVETREERLKQMEEELFGDESDLLGRTITGEAIAMPKNYESQQKKES